MVFNFALQSTNKQIVSTSRAYVFYDKTTGNVLHVHHSVSFAHATHVHQDELARARRLAGKKVGPNTDVLEVDSAELNHRDRIRIDPATRVVIREKRR